MVVMIAEKTKVMIWDALDDEYKARACIAGAGTQREDWGGDKPTGTIWRRSRSHDFSAMGAVLKAAVSGAMREVLAE
jgi:hypothetical protein